MRHHLLIALVLIIMCTFGARAEEAGPAFTPLFNGKDFAGWTKRGGAAEYKIEGEEIVGVSKINTENTFLCTDREYGDFILEVDLKVDSRLNSGIQIRSLCNEEAQSLDLSLPDGKRVHCNIAAKRVHGYQVEIDPSPRAWAGGIYDEARRGWLYNLDGDDRQAARAAFKNNEWNHYRIEARGPSLKTFVNDVPVADLHDELTPRGFIALQVHSIGGDKKVEGSTVRWKNIRLQELAP